jgi:hypothetical protein
MPDVTAPEVPRSSTDAPVSSLVPVLEQPATSSAQAAKASQAELLDFI